MSPLDTAITTTLVVLGVAVTVLLAVYIRPWWKKRRGHKHPAAGDEVQGANVFGSSGRRHSSAARHSGSAGGGDGDGNTARMSPGLRRISATARISVMPHDSEGDNGNLGAIADDVGDGGGGGAGRIGDVGAAGDVGDAGAGGGVGVGDGSAPDRVSGNGSETRELMEDVSTAV